MKFVTSSQISDRVTFRPPSVSDPCAALTCATNLSSYPERATLTIRRLTEKSPFEAPMRDQIALWPTPVCLRNSIQDDSDVKR